VSRRGESHPPALAEPDVTVSRHPAPIVQPSSASARSSGSSHPRWLTAKRARTTRPLRSTRITGLRSYHGTVRPCAPHRYSAPCSSRCLGVSLATLGGTNGPAGRPPRRGDRFPRSAQEPRPRSRHLHAGHRLASQQAPARLIPGPQTVPGFDVARCLSTRHQWFACARLRDPHLPRSGRDVSATLTTSALDRRSSRWFETSPCKAAPEGHTSMSCTAPRPVTRSSTSSLLQCSWSHVVRQPPSIAGAGGACVATLASMGMRRSRTCPIHPGRRLLDGDKGYRLIGPDAGSSVRSRCLARLSYRSCAPVGLRTVPSEGRLLAT
jgi:hypothetical protein